MTRAEAYEEMVYREGYRRGKEEATKELMEWHDRVCEEMAKRHTADGYKMLDDGTLVVSVDDATAVTRVLVEDSEKNGDLYYADRPKGEWIKDAEWWCVYKCSVCGETFDELTDYCPNCGADMRGEE